MVKKRTVYIASVYFGGKLQRQSVFSTEGKAAKWMKLLNPDNGFMCIPYVIDEEVK